MRREVKAFKVCGLVCVGIGTWLVLDRYAVDSLAVASEKVQVTDDGLRELVCSFLIIAFA